MSVRVFVTGGTGPTGGHVMFAQARHVGMVLGRPDGYVSSIHLPDACAVP
jgi:hypothetical protein